MPPLKRLATKEDNLVVVECPVSTEELEERQNEYPLLPPLKFARKYSHMLFQPVTFYMWGERQQIQFNHCANPLCKWYGLPQLRLGTGKSHRYSLTGSSKTNEQSLHCNTDSTPSEGITDNCYTIALSNWSIAEEIARLLRLNCVSDINPQYDFHYEGCKQEDTTPFIENGNFIKRGKSTGNSQRWQCKTCKKITNILPERHESFTYKQKKNDILPMFAELLLNRTPVRRTCEILGISPKTYYHKLEWLYRRCLEFLERHETQAFAKKQFDTIWLDTDQMLYYLNNVRRKGKGGKYYDNVEDLFLPTKIIISCDLKSRYVFRSDVAYDWETTIEELKKDTELYKDDHLHEYARKNARLRFQFYPQPPTAVDTENPVDYVNSMNSLARREYYIDGLHTDQTYTGIAHYWLLKQQIQSKEWFFVSDRDAYTINAINRAYAREIRKGIAHYFICLIEHRKTKKEAFREYKKAHKELFNWAYLNGLKDKNFYEVALEKLKRELNTHPFYKFTNVKGVEHAQRLKPPNPISHPLPSLDEGTRLVDVITNFTGFSKEEFAKLILQVSNKATNAFMQQIHRRISILERPLMTARGDGKSYIYANFNPKYAQYAVTILRTYYNFCVAYKSKGRLLTPAQRLGISKKQFTIKDIIYFR